MNIYEILSPGGREKNMIEYIKQYAEKLGYACRCDTFGNLICGDGRVTVECGADTLSFMKTAETENGMIKIAALSSAAVKTLVGKRVRFLNGAEGVVRCEKTEDIEDFDLCVDIGETDKEGAARAVPAGEFGSIVCDEFETEKFIFGNGISSYIPILVMLKLMEQARGKAAFVFTVQKKFAGRGIKALLGGYETEKLISIGTTPERNNIKCGDGAAVVIKDKGAVPSVPLRKAFINSAEGEIQLLASEENLYLDLPQIFGKGAEAGGVCIAVRGGNGAYEGAAKSDIDSAVRLISNYLNRAE